jgi:7-carboxy-7-deazaguanine synthase
MDVPAVLAAVQACGPRHVVVTGGEPLLAADVGPLCAALRDRGYHVTIETAGTVIPADGPPASDLMSISPKLSSSAPPADTSGGWAARHEAARRRDDVIRDLVASAPDHQLKFVVETPADIEETVRWVDDLGPGIDRSRVLLMPQARTAAELQAQSAWLAGECARLGFRLAQRHHILWFGGRRGT